MPLSMITANATDDGAPIFLRADGSWTRVLAEGYAAGDDEAAPLLAEARKQQRIATDPYAIEVVVEQGRPVAAALRERIRAQGPTVLLARARVAPVHADLRVAVGA